jgi:hypothetical protein
MANGDHWRPWVYPYSDAQYRTSGYERDYPHQYEKIEIKIGVWGENIPLADNQLPSRYEEARELIFWRPLAGRLESIK